jgi:hypothetical protein
MSVALDLRHQPRHGHSIGADELEKRLNHLLAIGFSQEGADKIFEAMTLPPIAEIDRKLSDLKALGFGDPVKMVTSLPAILGLAIANIEGKLSDLKALGFGDPVKMVTSSPAILGYAIANIEGKLSDLKALGFGDPVKMVTSLPAILGYSTERVLLCGNVVKNLIDRQDGMFGRLISKRRSIIEAVVAASPSSWPEVLRVVRAEKTRAAA